MADGQKDDDFDEDEVPAFSAVKQQRKELIARLREGAKGDRRLASLMAQCRKRNRCNLLACPVCDRRKLLPKWRVPAPALKSLIGTMAPRKIYVDAIKVIDKDRRPLDGKKVRAIASSMDKIGQQIPITTLTKIGQQILSPH
jgi:hypothetical protein